MKKAIRLWFLCLLFVEITLFSPLVSSQTETPVIYPASVSLNQNDSFTPTVSKPAWVDQDNNGIADSLNQEINDRITNGTTQNYVSVTVMLKSPPTAKDEQDFILSGGKLTTPLWIEALYGFGGTITYNGIVQFVQRCPDVLLVEKEAIGKANVAYAAQQVGARPYVWNTLGLQGDPNSSIAILDSGIDSSHVDFSPGYGDQNFSKKIVGWNDQVNFTSSPFDDNGHGSHVAGLAAGNGFFSNSSSYATATWGMDLTGASSGNRLSGMMVNNSGTITLNAKWMSNGTAKVNTLSLYKSGKSLSSSSLMNFVNTPTNNTWYTLSFNVTSIPTGGYDMYNPRVDFTNGTGHLFAVVNMSWPYTPPSDNFSAWTGIAPQSKLVGVKVVSQGETETLDVFGNQLITGINWLIANEQVYHITVASMSLGMGVEKASVDTVVSNLVRSGVTTVVSAGNDGNYYPGSNTVFSPGSVDEVITVAAMNQFENIANYSSRGGISRYTGKTIKPDITAPGGTGAYAVPLFSADSNFNDARGGFTDVQANDAAPMQGTSMAAPIIAGCAQVVIQAMGGYSQWNWSRSQALQPKMILLMTATETYPNLRERGSISTSPTLQRGGKDLQEGYGRVNLDAAVDALLKTYEVGNNLTDNIGNPPKLTDISVVGQRLAWARQVSLESGNIYNFSLTVQSGADYDLYLYNSTGTNYGEPSIVAKSTTSGSGNEHLSVAAPYSGKYYVVVKRATEDTGSGNFILSSSSQPNLPVNVTLTTPGLNNALNVVHYILNGVVKTGSIVENRFSDYADVGTNLTVDNPVYETATQRYRSAGPTVFTVQPNFNVTNVQPNITIESSHPYNSYQDSMWTYTFSNATKVRVHFNYTRTESGFDYVYVLDSAGNTIVNSYTGNYSNLWSGWVPGDTINIRLTSDYSVVSDGFQIDSYQIEQKTPNPDNHTATYKTEYFLQVNSPYGVAGGESWYENGKTANSTLNNDVFDYLNGTRVVFTNWTGDASGSNYKASNPIIMNTSKTVSANWRTQYYLTVSSAQGASSGSGWYDSGTTAFATLSQATVAGPSGTQYVFTSWSGDASGTGLVSNSVTMNSPNTVTANWKTQYLVAFTFSPSGGGSTNPSGSNIWEDAGSLPVTASPNAGYTFSSWASNTGSITFSNSNSVSTTATISGPGTMSATFAINTYTISASAGANGAISPSGSVNVNSGDSQSFNVAANAGYHIVDVVVDGVSQGAVSSYIFSNVVSAHTITATFALTSTSTTSTTSTTTSTAPVSPKPNPITPSPTPTSTPTTPPTQTPTQTPKPQIQSNSTGMLLFATVIIAAFVISATLITFRLKKRE